MGWLGLAGAAGGATAGGAAAGVAEGAAGVGAGLGAAEGAAGLGAASEIGAGFGASGLSAGLTGAELEGMTGGMSGMTGLGAEASQGAAGDFYATMWNASGVPQKMDSIKNLFAGEGDFSDRLGKFAGETYKDNKKNGGVEMTLPGYQEQKAAAPTEGTPMMFDAESELNRLKTRMGQQ